MKVRFDSGTAFSTRARFKKPGLLKKDLRTQMSWLLQTRFLSPTNEREAPEFRHGEDSGSDDRRIKIPFRGWRGMVASPVRYGCLKLPCGVMLASPMF
ncbi:hypothetical protein QUB16_00210 [Microcoleus sp. D3_18a_C4]